MCLCLFLNYWNTLESNVFCFLLTQVNVVKWMNSIYILRYRMFGHESIVFSLKFQWWRWRFQKISSYGRSQKCLFIQSTEKYSLLFVCWKTFYSKPTFFLFFFLMTNDVKAKICQKLEWFMFPYTSLSARSSLGRLSF